MQRKRAESSSESLKPVLGPVMIVVFIASSVVGTLAGLRNSSPSDFYREAIAEIGFIGLLWYWLYRNRHRQQVTITVSYTRLWLLGLLLLASLSAFWAVSPDFFVGKYLLWLAAAAVVMLTLTLQPDRNLMVGLARGFTLIGLYIAIVGLVQALLSIDIFLQAAPPAANFNNKNAAMQVIVLVFPMIVFGMLFDRHPVLSKCYGFALALVLAYAFHTRTRSAWLALIVEGVVMTIGLVWLKRRLSPTAGAGQMNWSVGHQLAALSAVLVLVLLITLPPRGAGFGNTVAHVVTSIQRDASSYDTPVRKRRPERYRIWDSALVMVERSPFLGTGMGSFFYNILTNPQDAYVFSVLRVHNDMLEVAVELGGIGVLLLGGAIVGLLCGLSRLVRQGEPTARGFFMLVAAALAGSAVNMQFSFPYQMPVPTVMFGAYAGLVIKSSDAGNARRRTMVLSLKSWHWYAGLTVVGCILALVVSVNMAWMNVMDVIEDNVKIRTWENPIDNTPMLCPRGIVRALMSVPAPYRGFGLYRESQSAVESINNCVPDTWLAQQETIQNLLKQKQFEEAIAIMEHARHRAPVAIFIDYVNLIFAHLQRDDMQAARRVYEQLRSKPTKLLIQRKMTLRTLILFALRTGRMDEASTFRDLYLIHYPGDKKFAARVAPHFQ
ncbi:MAG: O-antigen ligase family protein [Nitrospira sp.]|nr:O-antigen ligase family protein [Nitrospira sp.]